MWFIASGFRVSVKYSLRSEFVEGRVRDVRVFKLEGLGLYTAQEDGEKMPAQVQASVESSKVCCQTLLRLQGTCQGGFGPWSRLVSRFQPALTVSCLRVQAKSAPSPGGIPQARKPPQRHELTSREG